MYFEKMTAIIAASQPSENNPPAMVAQLLKKTTDKAVKEKIMKLWAETLKKYPAAKNNWAAAHALITNRLKKYMPELKLA